jgi:hypothetical protein
LSPAHGYGDLLQLDIRFPMGQPFLGSLHSRLSPFLVNLIGVLGGIGQHGYLVVQYFYKTTADRQVGFLSAFPDY